MGYIIRELYLGNTPILHANGTKKRDFIYVDDLIDLALSVGNANTFDTVNVSTGTTATINEIYRIIADAMFSDIKPTYADISHFWANYPELYEKPYPISEQLMKNEVLKYTCLSYEHAKKTYAWEPKTSLVDGIRKTVDYSCKVLETARIKS